MPTFDTPGPISARIEVASGSVRVRADDRHDTVVTVRPRNEASSADVTAAEQTLVTFSAGELLVRSTSRPRLLFFGYGPEIEVDVVIPTGSSLDVRTTAGEITCSGRLGAVDLESKHGDLRLDDAGSLRARTSSGDISVAVVDGDTEAITSYGDVRVGETGGPSRLGTGYGDVTVDRALGSLTASTKYGQVRVGEAVRGSLVLETAYGEVEACVREGSAAWLDVHSGGGRIRNLLTETEGPEGAGETVEIHARTSYGDILIRRA
ncbi:DUF4097 family beta strand repeat-containing protein [Blastococcus tunisiensis]|uniref:DUF4097 and DUF4098 domain-containing protein YvlB n=1 Tax=Blastococcus tunisiensis TaxID=1798228 RepID=A0A1I2HZM0_9ACTN|nr:DUF4097 family beta strand repeat-containing protein [Blastococcus sp. DSM 46838]SFF35539.1 DUF4097 and DUF4098 domain-containing protein YvlB [Blastococcus sp. DSM 46838]